MSKVKVKCDACGGTGLAPRQDREADKDMHPIISQSQGLCGKCGGAGAFETTSAKAAPSE